MNEMIIYLIQLIPEHKNDDESHHVVISVTKQIDKLRNRVFD